MANKELKSQSSDSQRISRGVYSPPVLKAFGPVGTLTQGGTGNMAEASPTSTMLMRQMV